MDAVADELRRIGDVEVEKVGCETVEAGTGSEGGEERVGEGGERAGRHGGVVYCMGWAREVVLLVTRHASRDGWLTHPDGKTRRCPRPAGSMGPLRKQPRSAFSAQPPISLVSDLCRYLALQHGWLNFHLFIISDHHAAGAQRWLARIRS